MFTGHRFANIVGRPRAGEGIFAEAAPKHAHERTPKGGICDVNDIRKADSTPFNFGFRIQQKGTKEDTMAHIGRNWSVETTMFVSKEMKGQ